jgi:hypothetical protein
MNVFLDHLILVFSTMMEFLQETEKARLRSSSRALKSLVTSCTQWHICDLPCISNIPGATVPDNFAPCSYICIKCDNESDSEGDDDTSELKYINLDDCLYATSYLECCFIASTSYGWGMFAHKTIPSMSPLVTYTGELISNEETEKRQHVYDIEVIIFKSRSNRP